MNRRMLAAAILLALPAMSGRCADVLTYTDGKRAEGLFVRFQGGQFEFLEGDAKPAKVAAARVESLTLDPPVKADVRRRGGRSLDGVMLTGYSKPQFTFADGTGPVPTMQIERIQPRSDLRREMQHVAEAQRAATVSTPASGILELPIHTGVVTVVHFHMEEVASSLKQGNYIQERCAESKGKIAFFRVNLRGWDDPAARQYQIASVPQFWFYDRDGQLVRKLTDRFTGDDIDAAFASVKPDSGKGRNPRHASVPGAQEPLSAPSGTSRLAK